MKLGVSVVYWVAIVIYCLVLIGTFMLEKVIKKQFNLPKKIKFNKRFNKNQTVFEIIIAIIFIISAIMSSITVHDAGNYEPLNPIPVYLCLAIFMLVLNGFRGYMAKKFAKELKEHYIHFAYAVWNPIIIIVCYHATKLFFN